MLFCPRVFCPVFRPDVHVVLDVFICNLDELLVNINPHHFERGKVFPNADCYVPNIASNVQNVLVLKPNTLEVLEPQVLDITRVPVAVVLVVIAVLELLILCFELT